MDHASDAAGQIADRRIETNPPGAPRRQPFPIIDEESLEEHPKARKTQDMYRIRFSPRSEDWVTWTAFSLLPRCAPTTWWTDLVALAQRENPSLALPAGWERVPEIRPWECVPSPGDYERASRCRMRPSRRRVSTSVRALREPHHGKSTTSRPCSRNRFRLRSNFL